MKTKTTLLLFAGILLWKASFAQTTLTLQPGACEGKDAEIGSCIACGYANMNFGSTGEFNAMAWTNSGNSSNTRSLIQFDLSDIPAGAVVQSATLSLYFDPTSSNGQHSALSGPNDAYLQQIETPWDENTLTWNNQPSTSTTNQAYLPPSSSPTQDYTNIDVTTMIQGFVNNPNSNFGMMLTLVTEVNYRSLIFASSDNANPALHPKLVVTYVQPLSGCFSFQYSSCKGIDASIGSCVPCGYDNMNFGSSPEFNAMAWTNSGSFSNIRSLIKFDLSDIPTAATIQSASLSLYFDPTSSNGQHSNLSGANDAYLLQITSPWDENTVTWNNQPNTTTINQTYLPPSSNPTQDYLNIDITQIIQGLVNNPAQNYGMMLRLVTEVNYRSLLFASSDNVNPNKHPKLDVCYSIQTGIAESTGSQSFQIFPNPLTSSSLLQLNMPVKNAAVSIYDMLGKKIISKLMNGDKTTLEKGNLKSGIYTVMVSTNEKQFIQRMVVE